VLTQHLLLKLESKRAQLGQVASPRTATSTSTITTTSSAIVSTTSAATSSTTVSSVVTLKCQPVFSTPAPTQSHSSLNCIAHIHALCHLCSLVRMSLMIRCTLKLARLNRGFRPVGLHHIGCQKYVWNETQTLWRRIQKIWLFSRKLALCWIY